MLFQVKKKKHFEKSFWNLFFPASSTSGTPKKLKPQLSHEVGLAGFRVKKGRKATEEEEGEIVSDPSDSESRRGEKRSRRYSSISNPDVEEKTSPVESTEKGVYDIYLWMSLNRYAHTNTYIHTVHIHTSF